MDSIGQDGFKHATLSSLPRTEAVGIVLADEEDGQTGIYKIYADGNLTGCRTVVRKPAKHYKSVIKAWLAKPGKHEDRRANKAPVFVK